MLILKHRIIFLLLMFGIQTIYLIYKSGPTKFIADAAFIAYFLMLIDTALILWRLRLLINKPTTKVSISTAIFVLMFVRAYIRTPVSNRFYYIADQKLAAKDAQGSQCVDFENSLYHDFVNDLEQSETVEFLLKRKALKQLRATKINWENS